MMNASSQVLIWNTGEDQSISDYFHTWIVTLYLGFQKLVLSWLFNHCRVKIIPFFHFPLKILRSFQLKKNKTHKYLFLHLVVRILNFCYLIPKSPWNQTNWHCTTNCSTLRSFFLARLTVIQNTFITKPRHWLQ